MMIHFNRQTGFFFCFFNDRNRIQFQFCPSVRFILDDSYISRRQLVSITRLSSETYRTCSTQQFSVFLLFFQGINCVFVTPTRQRYEKEKKKQELIISMKCEYMLELLIVLVFALKRDLALELRQNERKTIKQP